MTARGKPAKPTADQLAHHLLALLRVERVRSRQRVNSIDQVGAALRSHCIAPEQAIAAMNGLGLFSENNQPTHPPGGGYVEEFCALVEEKRAQHEAEMKRRRKWRRAA